MKTQTCVRFHWIIWLVIVTLCTPVVIWASAEKDGAWKKYREEDGIIGYQRDVARSKYPETKAETVINAPMEVLLEVLMDIPSYPQWMHKCKETALLEQKDDYNRVLYFAQGVPMGSPDRDAVIKATTIMDFNAGTSVTTLRSIDLHLYKPGKNNNSGEYNPNTFEADRQRMIEFSGKFELRMLDRNRTWVRYTAYTNPGGFAPRFVVKGVIQKVSFETVRDWIQMAKKPKYIKAAAKGIVIPELEQALKSGKLTFSKAK
jgi:hypothetical protein